MSLAPALLRPRRLPPNRVSRIRGGALLDRFRAGALGRPALVIGVVTGGRGTVLAGARDLPVRAGETFAIPAAALGKVVVGLPPRAGELGEVPT